MDLHRALSSLPQAPGRSSAAAAILRRMSPGPEEAELMDLMRDSWSGTRGAAGAVAGRGAAAGGAGASMTAWYSSAGVEPTSWAAAVAPAEVPTVNCGALTSRPSEASPASTPISQAFPVAPPPPSTRARAPVVLGRPER